MDLARCRTAYLGRYGEAVKIYSEAPEPPDQALLEEAEAAGGAALTTTGYGAGSGLSDVG